MESCFEDAHYTGANLNDKDKARCHEESAHKALLASAADKWGSLSELLKLCVVTA